MAAYVNGNSHTQVIDLLISHLPGKLSSFHKLSGFLAGQSHFWSPNTTAFVKICDIDKRGPGCNYGDALTEKDSDDWQDIDAETEEEARRIDEIDFTLNEKEKSSEFIAQFGDNKALSGIRKAIVANGSATKRTRALTARSLRPSLISQWSS